jgi:hypothetical protein
VRVHGGQAEVGAEHGSATSGRQHEAGPALYKIVSQGVKVIESNLS